MAKLALSKADVTGVEDGAGVSVLVHGNLLRLLRSGTVVYEAAGAWQVSRTARRTWTVSNGETVLTVVGGSGCGCGR